MNPPPDQPPTAPPAPFKSPLSHYWLDSWLLAALIEHAVRRFCLKHLDRRIDPCGRLFDQMTMAARSVAANIAEGNARRSTSRETQMRLLDVARALTVLVSRLQMILNRQLERAHAEFLARGGFAETLSRDRIAARAKAPPEPGAPPCPGCGKPMQRRLAKRGPRAGHTFWSCPDYPNCAGKPAAH